MNVPACRHRGLQIRPGSWACNSSHVVALGGIVTESMCAQECPFVDVPNQQVIASGADESVADRGFKTTIDSSKLAIAMITANRAVSTVERSVAELRHSGFDQQVLLFAEPEVNHDFDDSVTVFQAAQRRGLVGNWIDAARTTLSRTRAPYILLCHDDVQFAKCAAASLHWALNNLSVPHQDWGYASLFTPEHNVIDRAVTRGWQPIPVGAAAWGALALCFCRESLQIVLDRTTNAACDEQGFDLWIAETMQAASRICFQHVPSLSRHLGDGISTIGSRPLRELSAVRFSATYDQYTSASSDDEPAGDASRDDAIATCSDPSVTVVVASYNCAPWLHDCIVSLQRQSVACEIVVVDDGSTDHTESVLASFAHSVRVIRHQRNQGANAARLAGLKASTSTWVLFADADAVYEPNYLRRLLDHADHRADVVYCSWLRVDTESDQTRLIRAQPHNPLELWWQNYISMCSLVRRSTLSTLPGHGLNFEGCLDDWSLWMDLALKNGRFIPVDEVLFTAYERPSGKTHQVQADLHRRSVEIAKVRRLHSSLIGCDQEIAVVIPAKDCADLSKQCLWHLARYSGLPLKVIYVDNGSRDGVVDELQTFAEQVSLSLDVIRNHYNAQFTVAVNQGIRRAEGRHVLCLNNDCFIGPECIERLYWHLTRGGKWVAAVGPVTGDNGHQSLQLPAIRQQACLTGTRQPAIDLYDAVAGFHVLNRHRRTSEMSMLAFFCTLLNRRALREIGHLDDGTDAFASGLGADDEWCQRAQRHGWHLKLALDSYAAHLGSKSFERLRIDRRQLQEKALAAFQAMQ